MAYKRLLFLRESGLGDDLMVFWAAVGAVLAKIIPPGIPIYFEKEQTRQFLRGLAPLFPEIDFVQKVQTSKNITYVRHTCLLFGKQPWQHLKSRFLDSNRFCAPYYHKWLSEFGRNYKPGPRVYFAIATGALKVWTPPYDDTYDGWQQLAIALDLSETQAKKCQSRLAAAWPLIRQRLIKHEGEDSDEVLLFPSAGSAQNLNGQFIDQIKDIIPNVKIARFNEDAEEADLHYKTIDELIRLTCKAKLAITTDSLSSHIAQFYAQKHVLLCSRSRPGNVCFPGAANTQIIDLGAALTCRPCMYSFRDPCCAGHAFCIAQKHLSTEHKEILRAANPNFTPLNGIPLAADRVEIEINPQNSCP